MNSHLGGGLKNKHNKNFLIHVAKIEHAASLNKAELINKCKEYAYHHKLLERDYKRILTNRDKNRYQELNTRPVSWSEKKARFGEGNSNLEPLGEIKKLKNSNQISSDKKRRKELANKMIVNLSNLQARIWKNLPLLKNGDANFKRLTKRALECFKISLKLLKNSKSTSKLVQNRLNEILEAAEELFKQCDEVLYNDQKFVQKSAAEIEDVSRLIIRFTDSCQDDHFRKLLNRIDSIVESLNEFHPEEEEKYKKDKDDLEEKCQKLEMKLKLKGEQNFVQKSAAEIEDVTKLVENFFGSINDTSYVDLCNKIRSNVQRLDAFNPKDETCSKKKAKLRSKCMKLEEELNARSEDISVILVKTKENLEKTKNSAVLKFEKELSMFLRTCLKPSYINPEMPGMIKIDSKEEFDRQVKSITQLISTAEQNEHAKRKQPWNAFVFSDNIKRSVEKHVKKIMAKKPPVI